MNINALSNLSDAYMQALAPKSATGTAITSNSTDPSSLAALQHDRPRLSPLAEILSKLQNLQQSDPSRYREVTSQVATNLDQAAQTATTNGNTAEAAELAQLSGDFKKASQDNTLPSIQDLAQAAAGAHEHRRHGHRVHGSSHQSDATASQNNAASNRDNLGQLISSYLVNASSSAQNAGSDPLSIITSTLSNAGLS